MKTPNITCWWGPLHVQFDFRDQFFERARNLILHCVESTDGQPPVYIGWRSIDDCVLIIPCVVPSKTTEPSVADAVAVKGDRDGFVHVVSAFRVHRMFALDPLVAREFIIVAQLWIAESQMERMLFPLQHIQVAKEGEKWKGRIERTFQNHIFSIRKNSVRHIVAKNLFPLVIAANPWKLAD